MIHIQKVLRLSAGDTIIVCDGNGLECEAVIDSLQKDGVYIKCGNPISCVSEPTVRITLFQGLPKAGKMETVVQKCVELGVNRIAPFLTERCVTQPKDSFASKYDRWQRVSEEAAKQSRRGIIPQICKMCTPDSFECSEFDIVLIAYENEHSITLKDRIRGFKGTNIAVLIGPEGGFSDREVRALIQKGAKPVSLGPRILRTETAGMAMIAQILYEVDQ
jgi:16S rRNA (uracil1498-N3)-methyltransferase